VDFADRALGFIPSALLSNTNIADIFNAYTRGDLMALFRSLTAFSFLAAASLPALSFAQDISTQILATGSKVEVDGLIDEWRTIPSQPLDLVSKSSHKGSADFSVSFQSLYDKEYLYFAITVTDEKFIRTTLAANGEDRLAFWFGADAKGSKSSLLSVYPADLNGSIGQDLKFAGKKVSAPKAGKSEIEALEAFDAKSGKWMMEMKVPWARLAAEVRPMESIPFCIAVFDNDNKSNPKNEAIASNCSLSSKNEPTSLGALLVEEQRAIMESFLATAKISRADITKEHYADIAGDSRPERIVFAGSIYAVMGLGLPDGEFYFYRLTLRNPSDLKEALLMDVDGDGKPSIVIRSVEYDTKGLYSQEIIRVLGIKGGLLASIFGQEIANSQPEGTLTCKYEWKKKGKGFDFIVNMATNKGIEEKTYVDMDSKDAKDYEEILLPWGLDKKKTYRFSKTSYESVK
jgi:hypothetical protein